MILMGEWRHGREAEMMGGLGKSRVKRCKARQMWRICSAAVMKRECVCVWGGDDSGLLAPIKISTVL